MNVRNLGFAIIAAVAGSPAISGPMPQPASLTACANAFATSITTPGSAPRYKLTVLNERDFDSAAWIYSPNYTYALKALDKKGAIIARATCYATKKGVVKTIAVDPTAPAAPGLAKRF